MTATTQSNHWIDKIATGILSWQKKKQVSKLHVDDMKTPSGRVHTGSLVGAILHDVVAKAVAEKTQKNVTSTFVINDLDPMDGLPAYLNAEEYEEHMGKPLHLIPAPALGASGIDFTGKTAEQKKPYQDAMSFAEFYALDFIEAFRALGCDQEIVWSHQLYESGEMDDTIRTALDNVGVFKNIYKEVAEYQLPDNWYPFQVICPKCGKLGTTLVTGWDGEKVTFECQPNKVTWAVGCGHTGSISPFGGNGKLLWKVDWPGHWNVMGVSIEGAGKDHTSAGGSRDMANAICQQVFNIEPPFDIPYEWILIRGAKMSSSKGVGTSAREFTELFPAEVGRFLFVNKHYNQVLDFDPRTMTIPDLFDLYDQAARIYWNQEEGDQRLARSFELSQLSGSAPTPHFLPRFRDVATWMQHPEIALVEKCAEVKGEDLTKAEIDVIRQRQTYAQIWIDRYAPEEFQLTPKEELPEQATQLTTEQKEYLRQALDLISSKADWDPNQLQQELFKLAKAGIGAKAAFQSIYLAFLGKKAGPRAAWFLLNIDPDLREKRIEQIEELHISENVAYETKDGVSQKVRSVFPGMFFAEVKITGVTITKQIKELEERKKQVVDSFSGLTTQSIGELESIQAYRRLFKATGTDWHKRRPSPDALLRRIALNKGLYTVNTAVDAYNLAVIETGVGLGGFDAATVSQPITLRFSEEGELMQLLGDDEPIETRKGQLVYADQNRPITIDLNYRDINDTKLTTQTKDILLYADGAPGLSKDEVVGALLKGANYIQKFCGGVVGEVVVLE